MEKEKPPILGLIQRGGEVVLHMLANVQQTTIRPIIEGVVAPGSCIHTDEYSIYARLTAWGYEHKAVCHGRGGLRSSSSAIRLSPSQIRACGFPAPGSSRGLPT
ncbi:transposase, partial [Skermanella aerolata]|uniref:transposase n=1 Tax=Skermanella aerolata TaxID=393310 RepID=UPI003D1AB578